MATAYTPDEGLVVLANLAFKQADANRGTTLELGLHCNSTGVGVVDLGDITEPTGGDYARKTLTDASWTVSSAGLATYDLQVFTAGTGGYTGTVYGFFIATTGTSPKLLHLQVEDTGQTLGEGYTYVVDIKLDFDAG